MNSVRQTAYKIIYGVKYEQKYSNILLKNELEYLSPKDKTFVTYLTYGVIGRINLLDYIIKTYSDIAFSKISKKARVILEIGIFELMYMDSSMDYAAVNEAVELAKKYDKRAKNFINALLRKTAKDNPTTDDIAKRLKDEKFLDKIRIVHSVGEFVSDRLTQNYDESFVEELLKAFSKTPPIYIRGNPIKTDIDEFLPEIETVNPKFEVVDEQNMILKFDSFDGIAQNKLFEKGFYSVQDLASMRAVMLLDPRKGEKIADVCSAPGGKSIFAAQLMKNEGEILSMDISEPKLNLLSKEADRLGVNIIETSVNDASIYKYEYEEKFDKVICDVPCSGIGVMRRKPEIRYKKSGGMDELIRLQRLILKNSAGYLKKGGSMIYSTCTLGRQENADVVRSFLSDNQEFEIISQKEFYPHTDDTDGFYVCKMSKKR